MHWLAILEHMNFSYICSDFCLLLRRYLSATASIAVLVSKAFFCSGFVLSWSKCCSSRLFIYNPLSVKLCPPCGRHYLLATLLSVLVWVLGLVMIYCAWEYQYVQMLEARGVSLPTAYFQLQTLFIKVWWFTVYSSRSRCLTHSHVGHQEYTVHLFLDHNRREHSSRVLSHLPQLFTWPSLK